MPDNQPNFTVTFKELAISAIKRQTRGHVIIVLGSDTDKKTYTSFSEINSNDFDPDDYFLLELCFTGNPKKVTVLKKEENLSTLTSKLDNYDNYILIYPDITQTEITGIKTYLGNIRAKNNYSIAIFANAESLDKEYLINFVSDGNITISYSSTLKTLTPAQYTVRIAGILSGLSSSRSLTYFELNEIVDAPISSDVDKEAKDGNLIIIYSSGTYKLGRAVNSLVTLQEGVSEAFQKIRIVNIMDMIANDIITTFKTNYVGKYVNNYQNKKRFIGAVNTYLKSLAGLGVLDEANDNEIYLSYEKIKNYIESKGIQTSNMSYQDIITYNTGSYLFVDGVCSPVDCMEDLDLGFYLFQALESEV